LPKLDRIATFSGFNKINKSEKNKQGPINNEGEKDQIPKISKKSIENPPRKEEKQLMENQEQQKAKKKKKKNVGSGKIEINASLRKMQIRSFKQMQKHNGRGSVSGSKL